MQAAADACRMMGNRKFYDQLLLDTCQHQQMKITDAVDITTVKDYMKVVKLLGSSAMKVYTLFCQKYF